MDAAHELGIDPDDHVLKPRATRINNIAFVFARRALKAMADYDNAPKPKKKSKP